MRWSDLKLDPPARVLRQFAGLWLVLIGGIALWQGLARERTTLGFVLGALAVLFGVAGMVWPKSIRPLFVGLTVATFPIGWVVTRVVLLIMFYGLFTPLGLVFKLMGRDALGLKQRPQQPTYWLPKPMPSDVRSYFRLS